MCHGSKNTIDIFSIFSFDSLFPHGFFKSASIWYVSNPSLLKRASVGFYVGNDEGFPYEGRNTSYTISSLLHLGSRVTIARKRWSCVCSRVQTNLQLGPTESQVVLIIFLYVCVCVRGYYKHTYIRIYVWYIRTYIHTYIYPQNLKVSWQVEYIFIYVDIYTNTHTHTHRYTHTQNLKCCL